MNRIQVVSWVKRNGIATVAIDNPPVNALSGDVIEQLNTIADEVENDPSVKVVIVIGGGDRAFVAGGDIKMFPEWMGKGVDYGKEKSLWLQEPLNKIDRLSKPTIAAINGVALGGGCELALCCDIRIAEEHIQIGLPEVTLGLFPGAGGTQRLPRLVGKSKAKEMILTGTPLTAEEAKQIGLVNHVVPKGQSLEKAIELARIISSRSFPALSYAKHSIDVGFELPLEQGLVIEAENFGHIFQTEDVREGVGAFIEKRKPTFEDR